MLRFLVLTCALLVVAVSARDQVIGNPQPGDLILKKQSVDVKVKPFQYVYYEFNYPNEDEMALNEITGVTIRDNSVFPDPTVKLVSGGPNNKRVTLQLKSFFGVGIHVEVIVHGKKV